MKKALIVLLVIAVAGAMVFYFFVSPRIGKNPILPVFPDFFPQEMIADSYTVDLEILSDAKKLEGERERVFVSYKSHRGIPENIKSFNDYFWANGYFLTENLKNDDKAEFVEAKKDKILVNVSLWKESPIRVSILYIILK